MSSSSITSIIKKHHFHNLLSSTSSRIDDFIIEESLKNLLKTMVKIGDLNMIFFGETGTGKSQLISVVLNEYYKMQLKEMVKKENVLYINNLKDQNIHAFRQMIKNFCQTSFSSLKHDNSCQHPDISNEAMTFKTYKKTIVVDDIDLLNLQNQQIIRHYIDKYSNKINFIGSCSNIQNVLDNIQSRTMIFQLNYIDKQKLYDYIDHLCDKIGLKECLDKKCKMYLIESSNYSIKVLHKYLQKILYLLYDNRSYAKKKNLKNNKLTIEVIKTICNNISFSYFDQYFNYLTCQEEKNHINNHIRASRILLEIYENGYSVIDILENMFYYVKTSSKLSTTQKYKVINYITKYINIFYTLHESEFELILLTNELKNLFANLFTDL
jgi:DNA polymerase III delta prime subunit